MKDLYNILFLDIETVSAEPSFEELSPRFQSLWEKKAKFFRESETKTASELYEKAGIYAEFGKIVSIAVGYFIPNDKAELRLRVKAFSSHNEKKILETFSQLIDQHFNSKKLRLCAHNGKEFDFPYIGRRMVINAIPIPEVLNLSGKKPWEVAHLDTMELWKFGDYKHFTSLDLLAHVFNIPSPKQDLDGSMVAKTYYEENDLEKIKNYCQNDVITIAQLLLKYKGKELISSDSIEIIE